MSLTKLEIDPDKIFFINEKRLKKEHLIECKLCGNLIHTDENYSFFNGNVKDCPYCRGNFPQDDNK